MSPNRSPFSLPMLHSRYLELPILPFTKSKCPYRSDVPLCATRCGGNLVDQQFLPRHSEAAVLLRGRWKSSRVLESPLIIFLSVKNVTTFLRNTVEHAHTYARFSSRGIGFLLLVFNFSFSYLFVLQHPMQHLHKYAESRVLPEKGSLI